ncbi:F-box-like domain-containing protein [Legionella nautarum]|uniref:F-box-like domain-containing protein n=1 Tax=Legionella nautarum TaxID=45070 RepID=UPI001056A5EB|nr:F-box-like domain-containing protein [Legionella nautarum]
MRDKSTTPLTNEEQPTTFEEQPTTLLGTLEFPHEILLSILSSMDLKSLWAMRQVNTLFQGLTNEVLWKRLLIELFSDEISSPLPAGYNYKKEFMTLYAAHYGHLDSRIQKLIFSIVIDDIDSITALNISTDDIQTHELVVIKTAAQLKRQNFLNKLYQHLTENKTAIASLYSFGPQEEEDDDKQLSEQESEQNKLLGWAVLCNIKEEVHSILKKYPHLLNYRIKGESITMLAAEAGHLDLLLELLKDQNNQAATSHTRINDLFTSIIHSGQMLMLDGFNAFIKQQLQTPKNRYSAQILAMSKSLPHPIFLAATLGVTRVFRQLVGQYRESISNAQTPDEPFSFETMTRDVSNFKEIIEKSLFSAADKEHISIIDYALNHHLIAIDDPLNDEKESLLTVAAESNHIKLMRYLLTHQADPELALLRLIKLSSGFFATNIDYQERMTLLLAALKEQKKSLCLSTLLDRVIFYDRNDLLEQLCVIDNEIINFNPVSELQGSSPLKKAVDNNSERCIQFLLSQNVTIDGEAFRLAFERRPLTLVEKMLKHASNDATAMVEAIFGENLIQLVESLRSEHLISVLLLQRLQQLKERKDVQLQKQALLLSYADVEKLVCQLIKNEEDTSFIRYVIQYLDIVMDRPINKKNILAFAKDLKQTEVVSMLEKDFEIGLEEQTPAEASATTQTEQLPTAPLSLFFAPLITVSSQSSSTNEDPGLSDYKADESSLS